VAVWPDASWEHWSDSCDTLHAHTQVPGKIAGALAPPEPELQHAALRLTARGWETAPLPALDGAGAVGITVDLRTHETVVGHSDGRTQRVALTPDRPVGEVTRAVLAATRELAGRDFEFNPKPSEVAWSVPLDADDEHRRYDAEAVRRYFEAAHGAASVLAAFRAPYRGRSTQVNAWWGSFDLAVALYSGRPAEPPSQDFILRNAMDAEEFSFGWWPGDARHPRAAFYAYVHPARDEWPAVDLELGRWDETLGEYILDDGDLRDAGDALAFARTLFEHACAVCEWDPALESSAARSSPPPVV
jgi:hypothetical protein